jgi:CheY-like chemotaxis protein
MIPVAAQLPLESEQAATGTTSTMTVSLNNLRVLIVDDELDAREMVSVMLSHCGADMKSAASASEALEIIESWKPDVLIADIGMPIEDGYGLIKRLRALPKERGGHTPALALTAYARNEDRIRALSEGYQVHLSKPVDRAALAAVVAKLAERSQI